jgi:ribosomal protein S1
MEKSRRKMTNKKKELDASGYVLDMAGVEIPLRSAECDGDIEDIKDLVGKELKVRYMEIRRKEDEHG